MDRPSRQHRSLTRVRDVAVRAGAGLRGAARLLLAGWLEIPPRPATPVAEAPSVAPGRLSATARRVRSASTRNAVGVAALAALLAVTPTAAQGQGRPLASADSGRPPLVALLLTASSESRARGWLLATEREPTAVASRWDGRETSMREATVRTRLLARGSPPAPQHEVLRYRAQPGEALWVIADKFDVSPMTVWWANRLIDKDTLKVGELVRILPTTGIEHLVHDGDTLDSIARDYRADADAIAVYNSLEGGVVVLGQRLIVPDGKGSGYEPIPGVSRKTALPRLRPGQAGRAVVEEPAVAAPLVQPVVPEGPQTGVKRSGGVAWPSDPTWIAGGSWSGPLVDQGTGIGSLPGWPGDRPGTPNDRPGWSGDRHGWSGELLGGSWSGPLVDQGTGIGLLPEWSRDRPGPSGDGPGPRISHPPIRIPGDAPVPDGHGERDTDWPVGPPAGPPQGTVLEIDDARLLLTEAAALRSRPLLWPVFGGGRLTQGFDDDHAGIDIAALRGTPILAAFPGRVVFSGWRDDRSGNAIYLKHGDRFFTAYLHLWNDRVEPGDWVRRGQVIGYMGSTGFSTGSHLHFSVTVGTFPNVLADTRDPLRFLSLR